MVALAADRLLDEVYPSRIKHRLLTGSTPATQQNHVEEGSSYNCNCVLRVRVYGVLLHFPNKPLVAFWIKCGFFDSQE